MHVRWEGSLLLLLVVFRQLDNIKTRSYCSDRRPGVGKAQTQHVKSFMWSGKKNWVITCCALDPWERRRLTQAPHPRPSPC